MVGVRSCSMLSLWFAAVLNVRKTKIYEKSKWQNYDEIDCNLRENCETSSQKRKLQCFLVPTRGDCRGVGDCRLPPWVGDCRLLWGRLPSAAGLIGSPRGRSRGFALAPWFLRINDVILGYEVSPALTLTCKSFQTLRTLVLKFRSTWSCHIRSSHAAISFLELETELACPSRPLVRPMCRGTWPREFIWSSRYHCSL